jgi:hypothetical protein
VPFLPGPSPFEDKIAIAKLIQHNMPGSHQILVDVIQARGEAIQSLILFGVRKNCLTTKKNIILYQFIRRAIKLTVVIVVVIVCFLFRMF